MRYTIFLLIFLSTLSTGCLIKQTDEELIASKCRLNVPVIKEQCEAVGVYGKKGGQIQGLPYSDSKE